MFLLCLMFLFFCFVKLALGLNNVCKVRCTNKQKRKRPLFGLYQKNHPKNKLLSAILYTYFSFWLRLSLYVLSPFLKPNYIMTAATILIFLRILKYIWQQVYTFYTYFCVVIKMRILRSCRNLIHTNKCYVFV